MANGFFYAAKSRSKVDQELSTDSWFGIMCLEKVLRGSSLGLNAIVVEIYWHKKFEASIKNRN